MMIVDASVPKVPTENDPVNGRPASPPKYKRPRAPKKELVVRRTRDGCNLNALLGALFCVR
jgi:hypothetical protein